MFYLIANGNRYENWKSVSVEKSIERLCGSFEFEATYSSVNTFPLKVGDPIQIVIDKTTLINGFIEKVDINYSANSHSIKLSGRDLSCDIVDSTLGNAIEFSPPTTLKQIIEKIISFLGITNIKVIEDTTIDPFSSGEIESGEFGINAFELIEKYAKKRQVIITTDADSNILITNAENVPLYDTVLVFDGTQNAMIKSCNAEYDNTKRFYKYIAGTQDNDSANNTNLSDLVQTPSPLPLEEEDDSTDTDSVKNTVSVFASSIDSEIRTSRIYNFVSEQSDTQTGIGNRAQWEMLFRKYHAFKQTYVLEGFYALQDNIIWQQGRNVKVIDSFSNVNDTLLITDVKYSYDLNGGSETTLTLLPKNAFISKPGSDTKKKQTEGAQVDASAYFDKTGKT